jgi:hypothetical protein
MAPQPDGRTYGCAYCGARVQIAVGAEQIAAGLAIDLSNVDAFLGRLAQVLWQGWAEHTRIQASGQVVHEIEIDLAPDVFHAKREGHRATLQHKRVVRGIALRTETLPVDRWYQTLTAALARHANENARAAWVLAQLGGGRGA